MDHLDENPLAFTVIFDILAASGPQFVALELARSGDASDVRAKTDASLALLLKTGILSQRRAL